MFTTKYRSLVFCLSFLLTITNWLLAGPSKITRDQRVLAFDSEGRLERRLALPYSPSLYATSWDSRTLYAVDRSGKRLDLFDFGQGTLLKSINLEGKAISLAEDSGRGRLYVLMQNPDQIQVLEARSGLWLNTFKLSGAAQSFVLHADTLYVSFKKALVVKISASDGRELSRISDVDAAVKAISIDAATDRLVFLHQKFVSVYRYSDERFVDFLKLEAFPGRIHVDSARGNLYVRLEDEPDTIAVYSLTDLDLIGWKNLKYRSYKGRNIDVSSFFVNSKTGDLTFVDEDSEATFSFGDTLFSGPTAPAALPPEYTPSSDIPVNQTFPNGLVPSCDIDGQGNLLFSWMDNSGTDGNLEGAYMRRFSTPTNPLENGFAAPSNKNGDQGSPIIAGGNDDLVVIWRDGSGKDGDSFGVYARVFDGTTAPPTAKTSDKLIPQTTSGRQMMPWVDMRPNGDFIAAWSGKWNAAGGNRQTFTRRFDNNGNAQGNEILANTQNKGNTWAVQVDVSSNGRFVVVWRDDGDNGLRGRAYDASGNPVSGSAFKVDPLEPGNTSTFSPSVGIKDDGSFVVVFKENKAGGVVGRRYDANQNDLGSFVATSAKTKSNDAPVIGMAQDGRFVVVWRDSGYGNDEIAARFFHANGTPNGTDFIVPEDPAGDEFEPHIAMDSVGNAVAVWKDRNRNPNIIGRSFFTSAPPSSVTVTDVTPGTGNRGTTDDYTVEGTGFDGTATVDFNDPGIIVNSYGTITATTIDVNVTIQNSAVLGFHDVEVTVGANTGVGADEFEVKQAGAYPAPTVILPVPAFGLQNTSLDVLINGTDFANHPSLSADFGPDITVNNVTFLSGTQISASISIGGSAATGLRDVSVSNPGPSTGTCTDCFDVIFNPTLFSDDFGDGVADGWTPEKGSWDASSNALVGTQTSGKATSVATIFGGCILCSVEADIRVGSGDKAKISLMGWYVDNKNYVELMMDRTKDKWKLKHRSGGSVVGKAKYSDPTDLVVNTLYHARITYDGAQLQLFVHGGVTPVATLNAAGLNGTIAFRVKSTSGTIDNVMVNPFP